MKFQRITVVASGGLWRVTYHISDAMFITILVDRTMSPTKAQALEVAADLFDQTF